MRETTYHFFDMGANQVHSLCDSNSPLKLRFKEPFSFLSRAGKMWALTRVAAKRCSPSGPHQSTAPPSGLPRPARETTSVPQQQATVLPAPHTRVAAKRCSPSGPHQSTAPPGRQPRSARETVPPDRSHSSRPQRCPVTKSDPPRDLLTPIQLDHAVAGLDQAAVDLEASRTKPLASTRPVFLSFPFSLAFS